MLVKLNIRRMPNITAMQYYSPKANKTAQIPYEKLGKLRLFYNARLLYFRKKPIPAAEGNAVFPVFKSNVGVSLERSESKAFF